MRQILARLIVIAIFAFVFVGFLPNNARAGVNDFSFSSFDADYYLSKDSEGRSVMKVVERLTAEFPAYDQNKGIERAIPSNYDGHPVSFHLESLTRNGLTEPVYETRHESNFTVVATGTEDYVRGTQKYVFTYTLRDVTKSFDGHQELYWDTNGTGWNQRFDKLSLRVHLDDSVKSKFSGDISCYEGTQGSNTKCAGRVDDGVIVFNSNGILPAGENLTFDLSFTVGTFLPYQMTLADMIPYALQAISVLIFLAMIFIKVRYGKNNPGRGTIVPEYLPPKDVSVLLAAEVSNNAASSSTAQIMDLAVRHKIKVIETENEGFFGIKAPEYTLELSNIDGLNEDELGFVSVMFESNQIGSRHTFSRSDTARAVLLRAFTKKIGKKSENEGYRLKRTTPVYIQSTLVVLIIVLSIAGFMISSESNDLIAFLSFFMLFIFIALIGIFRLTVLRPLTAKGRELYDYLKGLEMYIKLAETDRLRVLQSPEGAEKRPIDTEDKASIVVLYERVLPYAVLFGEEKEWLKQLGTYYEASQTTPGWYSGVNAFNAASFASSVSSFSSYASSSSFSSSSGSGGGGSSGGGGGGGGGGGR